MIFRLIQVRSVEGMRRVHALDSNDAAGFIPFTIITTVRSGFTVFLVTTVTPYGVDSRFFLCEFHPLHYYHHRDSLWSGFTVFLVTTVTPYGVDSRFFLCELLIPSLRRGGGHKKRQFKVLPYSASTKRY